MTYDSSKKDDSSTAPVVKINKVSRENNENAIFNNSSRKKTLILGDLVVKHFENWHLNKQMKYKSLPAATSKVMKYHLKCTVCKLKKALFNDCLRVSKVP